MHGGNRADVARLLVDAIKIVLDEREELHAFHEVVDNTKRLQNEGQRSKVNVVRRVNDQYHRSTESPHSKSVKASLKREKGMNTWTARGSLSKLMVANVHESRQPSLENESCLRTGRSVTGFK